jgi:methyl-accepting chemotaxis protein
VTYQTLADEAIQLKKSGKNDEYITFLTKDLVKTGDDLKVLLDDAILSNMQQAEQAQKDSEKAYQKSRVITLSFVLLVVALSIVFGIVIARMISRPLYLVSKSNVLHNRHDTASSELRVK